MMVCLFVTDLFGFGGSPSRASSLRKYGSDMPDYRRLRVPGGACFFTVNLLERKQEGLVRHIDDMREAVRTT